MSRSQKYCVSQSEDLLVGKKKKKKKQLATHKFWVTKTVELQIRNGEKGVERQPYT